MNEEKSYVMSPNPAANTAFVRAGDWKGLSDSDAVVIIPYEPTYDKCQAWLFCLLISLAITVIPIAVVKFVKRILRAFEGQVCIASRG